MNKKHSIKNFFGAIAIPLIVAILLQGICLSKHRCTRGTNKIK